MLHELRLYRRLAPGDAAALVREQQGLELLWGAAAPGKLQRPR